MRSAWSDVYSLLSFQLGRMSFNLVSQANLAPLESVVPSSMSNPTEMAVKSLLHEAMVKIDWKSLGQLKTEVGSGHHSRPLQTSLPDRSSCHI
jgi:hypothetical protein